MYYYLADTNYTVLQRVSSYVELSTAIHSQSYNIIV